MQVRKCLEQRKKDLKISPNLLHLNSQSSVKKEAWQELLTGNSKKKKKFLLDLLNQITKEDFSIAVWAEKLSILLKKSKAIKEKLNRMLVVLIRRK